MRLFNNVERGKKGKAKGGIKILSFLCIYIFLGHINMNFKGGPHGSKFSILFLNMFAQT